jgi:hypothetical protein
LQSPTADAVNLKFSQSPLSPYHSPLLVFNPVKMRGKIAWYSRFAYLFLSIRIITSPTAMIAMIMPTVAGTM